MQHLELSDEEAAALIKELRDIIERDRYPFSERIRTLKAILDKLRPEPVREPSPAPKAYGPPRATAARRRLDLREASAQCLCLGAELVDGATIEVLRRPAEKLAGSPGPQMQRRGRGLQLASRRSDSSPAAFAKATALEMDDGANDAIVS
jgi:hypothetical protein